jgi:DNA replication protein DnaC
MQVLNLVKPKMGNVTMMCDQIIDDKLTKYPAVECAFSQCNFTLLCGKMGQGKTSMLISLLRGPWKKCFHNIYTIIPEVSLHSISKKDNIFINNMEQENIYHEYNEEILEELYGKLLAHANEDEYSLLAIDDMGALFKKDKRALVVLNRIITKMRHLKTTVILLCQNIYQLPKTWREIATNLITYNLGKSQMAKIFAEFYDYKENEFQQIMKLYKNPHDWLLLNLKFNRLFFGFEKEILFSEEEEPKTEQKM